MKAGGKSLSWQRLTSLRQASIKELLGNAWDVHHRGDEADFLEAQIRLVEGWETHCQESGQTLVNPEDEQP
jgi:hypothetical protein